MTNSILVHPVTRSATVFFHWNATPDEVSLHGERPIPFIGGLIRDLGFDTKEMGSLHQRWVDMIRICHDGRKNLYDLLLMFQSHLKSLAPMLFPCMEYGPDVTMLTVFPIRACVDQSIHVVVC